MKRTSLAAARPAGGQPVPAGAATQRTRWRRSAAALLVLAVACLVSGAGASTAMAEETCSSASGEASGTANKERQRVVNTLTTNLEEKQSFTFTWENGLEKVKLVTLTHASCVVTSGGRRKFTGEGAAEYDGEEGYFVKFAISITNKGVNEVVMRLFEGPERVVSFKFAVKGTEEFT
jgi:hypothetical protein